MTAEFILERASADETTQHILRLEKKVAELEAKIKPLVTSMWLCKKHKGHGFVVDCKECNKEEGK